MDPVTAGLVMGGIGAAGSYFGQQQANQSNVEAQRSANAANMDMFHQNQRWNERMANTAHQREMADLKAAGLNPLLSGTGGQGAASPTTAAPDMKAATVENTLKGLSTSVGDAARVGMEYQTQQKTLGNLDAQREFTKAQTAESAARTVKTATENEVLKKDIPKSEVTNDIYDIIRPIIKATKGAIIGSPKDEYLTPIMKDFDRAQKSKTINLNKR